MAGISREAIEKQGVEFVETFDLDIRRKDKNELLELITTIEKAADDSTIHANHKGVMLEQLTKKLLKSIPCFDIINNPKSDSNEYDFVVKLNYDGRKDRASGIVPRFIPDTFLIECKNYKKPVEVGLIGKFLSLMLTTNHHLGIFISNVGISGSGGRVWKNANAFLMKANLKYSVLSADFTSPTNDRRATILLDLTVADIKNMLEVDKNFFDLLIERREQISLGIVEDFDCNIQPHPNQGKIAQS